MPLALSCFPKLSDDQDWLAFSGTLQYFLLHIFCIIFDGLKVFGNQFFNLKEVYDVLL